MQFPYNYMYKEAEMGFEWRVIFSVAVDRSVGGLVKKYKVYFFLFSFHYLFQRSVGKEST